MKNHFYCLLLSVWSAIVILTVIPVQSATLTYSYDPLNRLTNAAYSNGSRESYLYDDAGNRLSRITSAATVTVDATPPSIPTNLVWLAFTPSQLSIGWDRPSDTGGAGLSGYFIYVNDSLVATTTSTNFLLTGLMPDSQYCVRVAAYDNSTNISAQSTVLCRTTPVFDPPLLTSLGFAGEYFQIRIVNGTPGPYEMLVSTNLTQWTASASLVLPVSGNVVTTPVTNHFNQLFYQLRWSTNAP